MTLSDETRAGPHVELERVHMAFGERDVFESLSCAFPRGKISVLLGGSGSGKTTILRIVAGLVMPVSGAVRIDGADISRFSERELFRVRTKVGMMFQHGALLDSMSVYDNLALPLREHTKLAEAEIAAEVRDRLDAVGLGDVETLLPGELSGGMVKRVALARAIIRRPEILLCDEPFSGLDPVSTKRIESLLVRVNRRFEMTTLVVSHHVPSTLRMADRVLLLLPDRVIEGSPDELRASEDPTVRHFLDERRDPEGGDPAEVEVAP